MTTQNGDGIAAASVTFCCLCNHFNKQGDQLFMYRNVVTELSPDRNGQDRNVPWQKRARPKRPRPKRHRPKQPRPKRPRQKRPRPKRLRPNRPDRNGGPDRNDSGQNGSDRNTQTESAKPTRPNRNVVFRPQKWYIFVMFMPKIFVNFPQPLGHSDVFYEEWMFLTCFHLYLHVFEHNHFFFLVTTQFCSSPVWRQKWGQKYIVSSAPQNAPWKNILTISWSVDVLSVARELSQTSCHKDDTSARAVTKGVHTDALLFTNPQLFRKRIPYSVLETKIAE